MDPNATSAKNSVAGSIAGHRVQHTVHTEYVEYTQRTCVVNTENIWSTHREHEEYTQRICRVHTENM